MAKAFEAEDGAHVSLELAGSQQLALQIDNGAPCQVFASADQKQMKVAEQTKRIAPGSELEFAQNRLVIVTGPKSDVNSIQDLTHKGLKLVLADKTVPAGSYALRMLAKGGDAFEKSVLGNVASYEEDVRSVLTKVELGEADAGIVYATDARVAHDVRTVELPKEFATSSQYWIAPIEGPERDLSARFVSFVMSPKGQRILTDAGFLSPVK